MEYCIFHGMQLATVESQVEQIELEAVLAHDGKHQILLYI